MIGLHRFKLLACAVLAVCCAGCMSSDVQTPETTLMGLGSFAMHGLGSSASMNMRVSNVNPDPITVTGLRVKLRVNGSSFAKAMGALSEKIPGYGTADVQIPATVSNLSLVRSAAGVAKSGKLQYELSADITFIDPSGRRTTRNIRDTGDMDSFQLLGR